MSREAVLGAANAEWSSRKPDESFLTLEALHQRVEERTRIAREVPGVRYEELRVLAEGDTQALRLVGKRGIPAKFTHWSFGQLCRLLKSPAAFLRELPATLTSNVLNNRLAAKGAETPEGKLLLEQNGETWVRAFTGEGYARIWDRDITSRLIGLQEKGWRPAPETSLGTMTNCKACEGSGSVLTHPAATLRETCAACGGGGQVEAKTRGLYASDHDVFAFMVDNDRRVFEQMPGGGLSRGFMVANSEVGDKSFWFATFLYAYVCANHNVWGAANVQELRIRHVGAADDRAFAELEVELKAYSEASAEEDEAKILRCRMKELGHSKDMVLDRLFALKSVGLSRQTLGEAYDAAEQHESWYLAAPNTAWGMGNGITEVARGIEHADRRVEVERAAGKVFEMGF